MKNFRYSSKRRIRRNNSSNSNRKTTVDLLRLIHRYLMSPQSRGHATFSRVNLEGSNVGSTMLLRRSGDSESSTDGCRINVYISSNVQGVNNSILVGSRVMMRDPGVEFSFSDPTLGRTKQDEEAKTDSIWGGWKCVLFLFFIIVFLLFLLV